MVTEKEVFPPPTRLRCPLHVPQRLLMGPGPSNVSKRVLKAMENPLLGHLHPEFLKIMDDVKEGLQYLFQTTSNNVFCVSGTGHAGMEAVMTNLLEPGEAVLIAKNGIWGDRAAEMARRQGAVVKVIEKTPGEAFSLSEVEKSLESHFPSLFFIVQVDSSTGVLQELEGIGNICKKYGALLAVDAVASLGGVPFFMDKWGVDVAYTGSQKVLSCPPSLAPMAVTDAVMKKIATRINPPTSFYLDFQHLANYWGCDSSPRRYHHTGPITSIYALREGLAHLAEEGLLHIWRRHRECALLLHRGLQDLGLELFVRDPKLRAPTITSVTVPDEVSWKAVTTSLMSNCGVEVSGGLGPTSGKIWRIGLLGQNCTTINVKLLLDFLKEVLQKLSKNSLKHKL